jgi:hypothetical protein
MSASQGLCSLQSPSVIRTCSICIPRWELPYPDCWHSGSLLMPLLQTHVRLYVCVCVRACVRATWHVRRPRLSRLASDSTWMLPRLTVTPRSNRFVAIVRTDDNGSTRTYCVGSHIWVISLLQAVVKSDRPCLNLKHKKFQFTWAQKELAEWSSKSGMKNAVFWVVVPCGLVVYRWFGGACRLHLQGGRPRVPVYYSVPLCFITAWRRKT